LAHRSVVALEQRAPLPVAEFGGALSRIDDVGKHDRRQYAVDLDLAARAGEKLLDLVADAVGYVHKTVIVSRQFDIFCAGNVMAEIAPGLDIATRIADAMHDQRRDPDRREDRADVDFRVHT